MSTTIAPGGHTPVAPRSHRARILHAVLVRVLGPLRVETGNGGAIEVRRSMERRLLSALAALSPDAVPVDLLVDALWRDGQPRNARKALQTNVLRLRQRLGADTIATEPGSYRLGDRVDVDAASFERNGDLSWWRGEPFTELAGWWPLEGRRTQLIEQHARAEERRAEAMLHDGHPAEAVAELERLVIEDGTREVRWTLLVHALVAADRRPDALRAFERARRTLAVELGIPPGAELSAAHDNALRADAPVRRDDPLVMIDRLLRAGAAAVDAGEIQQATRTFLEAAELARLAGDVRRFANAAVGAAGDGTRAALDALQDVTAIMREAVDWVPPGPTPTRSRLLARLSVLQGQIAPPSVNEPLAATALGIARALDDPSLVATALCALITAVPDPLRHTERQQWIDELLVLSDHHRSKPWRRWVLPLAGRERVLVGDVAAALAIFDDLHADATRVHDVVARHAANYGSVLAATTAGDWDAARAAAAAIRTSATQALFDPATATLSENGMLGTIRMLSTCEPPPPNHLEWPTPAMTATFDAWQALAHAHAAQVDPAVATLDRLVPALGHLEHDAYWLATLSMTAEAAQLCRHRPSARIVSELLAPCVELTITDPGLIYRGAAAHFAGLAAAVLHHPNATDLLRAGLVVHRRHGATWMVERSRAALADVAAGPTTGPPR